jgi:hypothetical protein
VNASDRLVRRLAMLLSVLCVAYFWMIIEGNTAVDLHFAPIFFHLLRRYDRATAVLAASTCLVALLWARPGPFSRLADFLGRHVLVVSVASVAAFSIAALVIYRNYPLSMDEYAAVFQSKIFASGRLFAEFPPSLVPWLIAPGFNGQFLLISPQTGHAIETYWPGFALLLAPFQFVGMPWLCNAVLGGLAIFLAHRITLQITGDRRAAGWAILFTVASSAFWANAISYYSMQAHLTANLMYVWLLLEPTKVRSFAAGLVGSLALILHNPVPHALFALPWIVAFACDADGRRRLVPLALGYLPALCAGLAWAWLRVQIFPASETASMVGYVTKGVFMLPDRDILDMRLAAAAKMWVWASPGVFCFAVLGFIRERANRHVRLLMLSALCTFGGYLFVKLDQGHGWGYRYFHSAWGAVPVLAACAMRARTDEERGLVSFAGAAAVLSLVALVPFQLTQIECFISGHLALVPPAQGPGANVFFVDLRGGPYISDMIQIDPLLRSKDLLLFSRGNELDTELVRQNWPNASPCGGTEWIEQWCLGVSRAANGGRAMPHFSPGAP